MVQSGPSLGRTRAASVFLKSLEIFGFKSFADRTLIEFSDGISALLGPNGCGKSNVVDAIKWVVGEQSARSLRADSMEDVIFNGTETRKPLSVAEVTVTISNEAGLLTMIDAPEVAIKRRLYRSGEAEYFINGNQVKLKELRELFWDTGIGKSAYSVMEQGKIDQILSSKPEDRRYLFEEAAGITKHKVRSREAEQKLEQTEENMRQVGGILAEVKRSHDSLRSQSEKTLKYRALKDEVFAAELDLHLLRLRQFVQEKDRRDAEVAERTKERDKVRAEIDSLNLSLEENFDVVNGMEAQLVEHQKTVFGLAVEARGKQEQRKLLSSRLTESKGKMDQARLRAKTLARQARDPARGRGRQGGRARWPPSAAARDREEHRRLRGGNPRRRDRDPRERGGDSQGRGRHIGAGGREGRGPPPPRRDH